METAKIEDLYKTIHRMQAAKHDKYEQTLSPMILSRFIAMLAIDDHIFDSSVLDLCTGFGNLSIGLSLIGAGYILGVDSNKEHLSVCNQNIDLYRRLYGDDGINIDLLLGDI